MKINELMTVVALAYPNHATNNHWSYSEERITPVGVRQGGTLEEAIVRELHSAFDPRASTDNQLLMAVRVLGAMENDLTKVRLALTSLVGEYHD